MSRTKEYIDEMMDNGIDVLAVDDSLMDVDYQAYLDRAYHEALDEMNRYFEEHPEETKYLFISSSAS